MTSEPSNKPESLPSTFVVEPQDESAKPYVASILSTRMKPEGIIALVEMLNVKQAETGLLEPLELAQAVENYFLIRRAGSKLCEHIPGNKLARHYFEWPKTEDYLQDMVLGIAVAYGHPINAATESVVQALYEEMVERFRLEDATMQTLAKAGKLGISSAIRRLWSFRFFPVGPATIPIWVVSEGIVAGANAGVTHLPARWLARMAHRAFGNEEVTPD